MEGGEGSCFEHFEDGRERFREFGFILERHGEWLVLGLNGYGRYELGREKRGIGTDRWRGQA